MVNWIHNLKILVHQWKAVHQSGSIFAEHIPRLGRKTLGRRIEASIPLGGMPKRPKTFY